MNRTPCRQGLIGEEGARAEVGISNISHGPTWIQGARIAWAPADARFDAWVLIVAGLPTTAMLARRLIGTRGEVEALGWVAETVADAHEGLHLLCPLSARCPPG